MHKAIGVDIYNFAITNDVGRCLSTASGGLNEHIPIVILISDGNKSNRSRFIQSKHNRGSIDEFKSNKR